MAKRNGNYYIIKMMIGNCYLQIKVNGSDAWIICVIIQKIQFEDFLT